MIRSAAAIIGLLASVAIPVGVQAQSEAPTVNGYLCQFANRCDGATEASSEETIEAPETKGFRLARATNSAADSSSRTNPAAAPRQQPRNVELTPARTPARTPVAGSNLDNKADLVISFELNSAQLTPEGRRNALVFAEALARPELSGKRFLIAGHTDALGSAADNMDLSHRRAQSVAELLVAQGVKRSQLEVAGYGESHPIAGRSASDPANRRVEAVLR